MDKDIIQILWSALLIVIVTIVPLVKKFKEMQRKRVALRIGDTVRPSGGRGHIRPGVRIPKNGRQVPKN